MSKFVQKTLHSLNVALSNSGMFYSDKDKLASSGSLEISSFITKTKNVTTKQEEEELILQYFSKMKSRLSEPEVSSAEIEEMVKISMVCEAMGYQTDFIYVHALKLAQKGNLAQKHIGYLSTSFFLHPNHELVILLINSLQKDLTSSNYLDVLLSLTAVCHIISHETVGNVMHLVEERLQHPMPSVRKCAVLTFAHCLQLVGSKSFYQVALQKMERALSDPDLEVVSVVIPTLRKIIKELSGNFSYLIDSLLQLLEQILMWRIPRHLNYSDIPAPWLQIEILKLLKHLCKTAECSVKLAPILKKILVQTGHYHTIAQAIVFQVIETVASIEADSELLEVAMSSVSLLLKSRDVNMKFMGLESLVLLMKKMEPNINPIQQEIIMDCLKLPDEMLQLKTLELMYYLSNSSNVQAICKKMVEFLDHVKLSHERELALKILSLAEKYHSRHHWYISVVSAVLSKVDHLLGTLEICKIINIINEDADLKGVASEEFLKLIKEKKHVASSVIKILSSVLNKPSDFDPVLGLLPSASDDVVSWVLICLMESILMHKNMTPLCTDILQDLEKDSSLSVSILVKQIKNVSQTLDDLDEYHSCQKIDPSLTFLDDFVLKSLQDSDSCYEPSSFRTSASVDTAPSTSLMLDSLPPQVSDSSMFLPSLSYSLLNSPSISFQSLSSEGESFSPLRNKGNWTKDGRSKISGRSSIKKENSEEKDDSDLFAGIG